MWDNQARGSAANRGEGQLEGEGALRDERREGGGDASASDGGEVEADEVERVRFVGGSCVISCCFFQHKHGANFGSILVPF